MLQLAIFPCNRYTHPSCINASREHVGVLVSQDQNKLALRPRTARHDSAPCQRSVKIANKSCMNHSKHAEIIDYDQKDSAFTSELAIAADSPH